MNPKTRRWIEDIFMACAVVLLLTLLAQGQIAAVVLIMVPLTFLFFASQRNK